MGGDCEVGTCEICGKQNTVLNRKYFRYPGLKCECCNKEHFQIVWHCSDCEPKEPREIKICLNSDYARKLGELAIKYAEELKA